MVSVYFLFQIHCHANKPIDFIDLSGVSRDGKEPELGQDFYHTLRKAMILASHMQP